jgi:hypothetical protein
MSGVPEILIEPEMSRRCHRLYDASQQDWHKARCAWQIVVLGPLDPATTLRNVRSYSPNSTASCSKDMSHRPDLQSKQHGVMSQRHVSLPGPTVQTARRHVPKTSHRPDLQSKQHGVLCQRHVSPSGPTVQTAWRHVPKTCLTARTYSPNSTASCAKDISTSGPTVQTARRHVPKTFLTIRTYSPNSTASCAKDMPHRPDLQSKQHGVMCQRHVSPSGPTVQTALLHVSRSSEWCATYAHSGAMITFPSDRLGSSC